MSLTGFYLYNRSDEPCANYFGTADQTEPNRFADPLDYILKRRPQILALNNTWVLSDSSVMALRFGMTALPRQQHADASPSIRRRSASRRPISTRSPSRSSRRSGIRGYDERGPDARRDQPDRDQLEVDQRQRRLSRSSSAPTRSRWAATSARLASTRSSRATAPASSTSTRTSPRPTASTTATRLNGNSFASFLLGFPSANSGRQSQITLSTPLNVFTYYYGGYVAGRLARELEVHAELRPAPRARDGLREQNNNFTVGFDPTATSALSSVTIPADVDRRRTPARTVTGGLMYAGVNGNKTTQGNPPKIKWSPRVGAVYSLNTEDRAARRLRRLLGAVQLPGAEPVDEQLRPGRLHAEHARRRRRRRHADRHLDQPVPERPRAAARAAALARWRASARTSAYVDQNSTAPRVQQYSVDLQRELPGNQAHHVHLHRRAGRSSAARRVERRRGQHQPARSEVPGARRGAERSRCRTRSSATRTPAPLRDPGDAQPRRSCCGRTRSSATSTRGT